MKSKLQLAMVTILVAIPATFAQTNEVKREGTFFMAIPPPGPGMMANQTFDFVASEFSFDGKVVKNAPYSAEAVTEMTQRLPDGNRISNKTTANTYRDSDGRTRREEKLGSVGPWSSTVEPIQTIFINDPVSNTHMVLDTRNKVARRMPSPQIRMGEGMPHGAIAVTGGMVTPPTAGVAVDEMKATIARRMTVRQGAGESDVLIQSTAMQIPMGKELNQDARTESLGSQMIEGVRADGTRTTITIPAGAIGNDLPILIVSERWFSPELQTVVMTKRSDPRMGETVYRLSNISRTEPSRTLFEAPSDYSVEDAKVFDRKMKLAAEEAAKAKKD
jgi:hypothetical protein